MKNFIFFVKLIFLFFIFLISVSYYIFKSDLSFTNISYFYGDQVFVNKFKNPLSKGNKIIGEFKAKENNLGIVAIAFDPYYKSWDDIVFRIKEKNEKEWYFVNKYWANQFIDFEYFSFGFPIIKESKDKVYLFEIESLIANKKEGVGIRQRFPKVVIKYKFDKKELLENKKNLILFLLKKIFNNFKVPDFIFVFLVSISPLLIYFLNFFQINTDFYKIFIIIFLIIDIFFIRFFYVFIFFILFFLILYKFDLKEILFFIIFFIISLPLVDILNFSYLMIKISIWFYSFIFLFFYLFLFNKSKFKLE